MEAIFRNLRTIETLKEEWDTPSILIYPSRTCKYDARGMKIPGEYNWNKHTSGVQKYFAACEDSSQLNGKYAAVAEAIAKDLELTGAPNPQKTVIVQEVSQDGGNSWTLSLMYKGGSESVFAF